MTTVSPAILAAALVEAGHVELAAAATQGNLTRSEAATLSVEFCQAGNGRLATLLSRFAHPVAV
jgi:hypothetical protein